MGTDAAQESHANVDERPLGESHEGDAAGGKSSAHGHHHGHRHEHHGHGHHHGHEHHHDEPMSQEDAVRSLLLLGEVALGAGDYESAVQAYASVLKLEPNETAAYNLGSFYARGLGVAKEYAEAARLFHQAELLGNERAGKLCAKCMYDYLVDGLDAKSPADVYAAMAVFVTRAYPELEDHKPEVNNGLIAIAGTLASRGAYAEALKVFGAAAEFGESEEAQRWVDALGDAGLS